MASTTTFVAIRNMIREEGLQMVLLAIAESREVTAAAHEATGDRAGAQVAREQAVIIRRAEKVTRAVKPSRVPK